MRKKPIWILLVLFAAHPTWADARQTPVAYLAQADGYWQAWVMAADGSGERQVTTTPYDKSRLSWYPDGRHLLVNGNQGELARVDIETGEETPVPLTLKGMNDAVLSPDGKQIAFSLSTGDSIDDNNIWLVNVAGDNQRKLTNMKGLQHEPVWSLDGKSLYFLSGRGGQVHDIWRIMLVTKELEQLTSSHLYHFDVAVASSGEIAFSSNRSGNYELWLREPNGGLHQLTNDAALDAKPAWSPNGTTLIFESTRSGTPNLWSIGVDGGSVSQLTHHKPGARAPVWYRPQSGATQ